MNERVAALLAHRSARELLEESDLVDVLGDVVPMSEGYIPVLQFFMRPDNLVALVAGLMEEPTLSEPKPPVEPGQMPTYDEYAVVYRAHWVFCSSSFSMQLIAAMIALKEEPRRAITSLLLRFNSRDTMALEAFTRFLNAFMDQYSPDLLLAFFEPNEQVAFVQTLLVLLVYEPVRDVLLRVCNEVPEDKLDVHPLLGVLLLQLSPLGLLENDHAAGAGVSPEARARVALDPAHERFSRMVFSCDLLTDLIHEGRAGSLGFALVRELSSNERLGGLLLDAALFDLEALPTDFANESYALKVLNSLLQQTQCGCVAKVGESESENESESEAGERGTDVTSQSSSRVNSSSGPPAAAHESLHADLPPLWKAFLARLPEVLAFLALPPATHFKTTHIQLVYLMLPVLNVACSVADRCVVQARVMEALLALMARFPEVNILHCAISRLFIVALEDSPFMFGKELPAFRGAADPLRLHLLRDGAFQLVLDVYDEYQARTEGRRRPPPAFLDVAISFDQAVTSTLACSAPVLGACGSLLDRWHAFRASVLLPTQTVWEEQYQVASGAAASGRPDSQSPRGPESAHVEATRARGLPGDGDRDGGKEEGGDATAPAPSSALSLLATHVLPPAPKPVAALESGPEPSDSAAETVSASASPADPSLVVVAAAGAVDVPTPLSALYNEEEKSLMRQVTATGDT